MKELIKFLNDLSVAADVAQITRNLALETCDYLQSIAQDPNSDENSIPNALSITTHHALCIMEIIDRDNFPADVRSLIKLKGLIERLIQSQYGSGPASKGSLVTKEFGEVRLVNIPRKK